MKSEKKIYFRGTISSLFNAAISCSDYTKKKKIKEKQTVFSFAFKPAEEV